MTGSNPRVYAVFPPQLVLSGKALKLITLDLALEVSLC